MKNKNIAIKLFALWFNTPRFCYVMKRACQYNRGKSFAEVVEIEYSAMRSVQMHIKALGFLRG